ncbi:hypothetical protein FQN53_006443 [Emmonsiellopsis sp. PD_33]|nr:hypothetical protein FQN53_006443 [Emmonsiellopsis sp. PD_33]
MSYSPDTKARQNQRRDTLDTLLGLPNEILVLIGDKLRPREVHIPQGAGVGNYVMWVSNTQSLLHLSNTCRRLRQLLIRQCFEVVYLRNTKESAAAVQRIFQGGFSKYVKEVRFFGFSRHYLLNHGKYAYIKATCPNLDPDDKLAHSMEYPNAPENNFPAEVEEVLSNLSTLFPAIETIRVEFVNYVSDHCPEYFKSSAATERGEVTDLARLTSFAILSNTFKTPLRSIYVTNRNHKMCATEWHFDHICRLFPGRVAGVECERSSLYPNEPSLGIVAFDSDNLAIIEVRSLDSLRFYAGSTTISHHTPADLPLLNN